MSSTNPTTWTLNRSLRTRGLYIQASHGTGKDRRSVTLGYLTEEQADTALLALRSAGNELLGLTNEEIKAWAMNPASLTPEARVETTIQAGQYGKLPFKDFIAQVYRPVRCKEAAKGTVDREEWMWKKILPAIGHLPLQKVDGMQIQRFLASKDTWGPPTQRIALNTIRCALKFAEEIGAIPEVPRTRPIKGSTKRVLSRPVALLPEEIEGILKHAASPAHRALYAYALGQGLRPSEASILTWEDVDWSEMTVHVRGSKTEGADRVIPLTPATVAELKPFYESKGSPTSGIAFSYKGRPIGKDWGNGFKTAATKAELSEDRRVFPNLCRHTFAVSCALQGVPKGVAKEMLGHSAKSEMLETAYSNPHPEQVKEAIQKLKGLGGRSKG